MHKLLSSYAFTLLAIAPAMAQWRFEGDSTPTWEAVIARFEGLDQMHRGAKLFEIGADDDGSPIHLFVISDGSGFTPDSIRAAGKNILWITNGIHPGEPDGIDASLMLAQALLESDQLMGLTVRTAVCIVPVYNVSGAKQRNSASRVNQNGPAEYGFRGNARNLDLNRDMIKADSRNTRSLLTALTHWGPDVYFETHVSNGADHQYVMELLTSQKNKLDPALSRFVQRTLVPDLQAWMERKGIPMCPYFETIGATPEEGLTGFVDGPRYSSGHAALRDRIGILSESHMLKPYADRVNATFQLMLATLAAMSERQSELQAALYEARTNTIASRSFGFNWAIDTTQKERLDWAGYAAERTPSKVSGLERVTYDRARPTLTQVPWMDHAKPGISLTKPKAYLIPQAWHEVIERLQLDGVEMRRLERSTEFDAELQYIEDLNTTTGPFEGHYLNYDIKTTTTSEVVRAEPGDVLVPMGKATDRLVMEILEPRASDSYFAWGFFDAILQQKEWFSDYIFEDIAAKLLSEDPKLRAGLKERCDADPEFASDAWGQLYYVYKQSPYFEKSFRRYPVHRIME